MDGGTAAAAAAKQVYERQPEINTQKVRDLQEQLAVSERFTADLMLNINTVEQQVRNYAEAPVIKLVGRLRMQTESLSSRGYVEDIYNHGEGRQEIKTRTHIWYEHQS